MLLERVQLDLLRTFVILSLSTLEFRFSAGVLRVYPYYTDHFDRSLDLIIIYLTYWFGLHTFSAIFGFGRCLSWK